MARLPRLWISGLPEHLIIRGNNRQAIFRSDGDRVFFHRCLVEISSRCQVDVHAYVLMGNHVHLLATGREADSISRMIQATGRRYVSYFNYLYKRTGTLWEGRFRSSAVQTDRYLLTCQRYIELNPVRAGIVADPMDFPWSSIAAWPKDGPMTSSGPTGYTWPFQEPMPRAAPPIARFSICPSHRRPWRRSGTACKKDGPSRPRNMVDN